MSLFLLLWSEGQLCGACELLLHGLVFAMDIVLTKVLLGGNTVAWVAFCMDRILFCCGYAATLQGTTKA